MKQEDFLLPSLAIIHSPKKTENSVNLKIFSSVLCLSEFKKKKFSYK